MSGLALFGLKYPSLLQFEHDRREETTRANLHALYGIERAPSDTYFRERLDELDPSQLRPLYKALFADLQRGKGLEGFDYLDGHYLLSLDGTGYFSSAKVHCPQCGEKHHRNGTTTYYHQMLGAVLVHPDHSEVFPLAPEPILKQDGARKNDCERNAAKRLLAHLRRAHPVMFLLLGSVAYCLPRAPRNNHRCEVDHRLSREQAGDAHVNFGYAGPLTEMVLLGCVAMRARERVEWDGPNMKITNVPEANTFLRRTYRNGWKL